MTAGGPGQLLFEFVRYWSHRAAGDSTIARQGRLVMFTEAVNSLVQRGRKATVNAVAHELGIDQSGASRLLSDAHSAGYVRTTRDPQDQRRRNITITQDGDTVRASVLFGAISAEAIRYCQKAMPVELMPNCCGRID